MEKSVMHSSRHKHALNARSPKTFRQQGLSTHTPNTHTRWYTPPPRTIGMPWAAAKKSACSIRVKQMSSATKDLSCTAPLVRVHE